MSPLVTMHESKPHFGFSSRDMESRETVIPDEVCLIQAERESLQTQQRKQANRLRQRDCRAKTKEKLIKAEVEVKELRLRLEQVEADRDRLQLSLETTKSELQGVQAERNRFRNIISQALTSMQNALIPLLSETATSGDIPQGSLRVTNSEPRHNHIDESDLSPVFAESTNTGDSILMDDFMRFPMSTFNSPGFDHQLISDESFIQLSSYPVCSPVNFTDLGGVGNQPIWTVLPQNTSPTCPLDVAIAELEAFARDGIAPEGTVSELSSSTFPQVTSLLCPSSASYAADNVISTRMIHHILKSMNLKSTILRLASAWIFCNLIRWRICQSAKSYAALPEFMRPTPLQLCVPHPIWVDTIVWPAARDRIIQELDFADTTDFRSWLGRALSVNWPHQVNDSLAEIGINEFTFSPTFRQHLSDNQNWTLDFRDGEKYNFLRSSVNVSA